jgi:hypothetical protein
VAESTEDQIKRMVGPEGFDNLKAQAAMINVSFSTFVFMANFEPVALLEMLHEAMLKRKMETGLSEEDHYRLLEYNQSE